MLDTYVFGSVSRISPEAPVPIVNVESTESRPGGAANVAMNIQSLGGKAVICSVIGNDAPGEKLLKLLSRHRFVPEHRIVKSSGRITTEKTRIFSRNHQMLRFDSETEIDLSPGDEKNMLQHIRQSIDSEKFDVVVLQDYNKGTLTKNVIHSAIAHCRKKKIPVAVDPKKKNFFEYHDVSLFKPNLREVAEALGTEVDKRNKKSLELAARALHSKLHHQITLITLSETGAFITDHKTSEIIPALVRNVADVSGAGDTVLSTASLCLALEVDFKTMGRLANIAGSLACEEVGVVPINKEHFIAEVMKQMF